MLDWYVKLAHHALMPAFAPAAPVRRPYLFADGANASKSFAQFIERYWPGDEVQMDWAAVTSANAFHKAFVYDALPVKKDNEGADAFLPKLKAARERLEAIAAAPDTHVRTGLTRADGLRGQLRQKGVDIQLAVDALSMAHRGAYSEAVIWTSDLDFLPLFEELVLMGVTVTLWHPPKITTDALIRAADRASEVRPTQLYRFLPAAFRERHPWPAANLTHHPTWNGQIPVQWEANDDGPAGYVEMTLGRYSVVWRDFAGPLALEIFGSNFDMIRLFAADEHGAQVPDDAVIALKSAVGENPHWMVDPPK